MSIIKVLDSKPVYIAIHSNTKFRLEELKKFDGSTYDDVVSLLLDYYESDIH